MIASYMFMNTNGMAIANPEDVQLALTRLLQHVYIAS